MREESGSEEDCDELVEWEGDDEVSSEEDGSEDEVRVSNAQRGRVRLHWAGQSSTGQVQFFYVDNVAGGCTHALTPRYVTIVRGQFAGMRARPLGRSISAWGEVRLRVRRGRRMARSSPTPCRGCYRHPSGALRL